MGFGHCKVCNELIEFGPVVVAEVVDGEITSHAHGQCWVDAGHKVLLSHGPFNDTLDNSWVPMRLLAELAD